MQDAILWAVIWGVSSLVLPPVLAALVTALGLPFVEDPTSAWVSVVFLILAWLISLGWFIFSLTHTIINIVTAVQLS